MDKISTPYEAGYDSVVNGPNTENCNFKWFGTPENTKDWEQGAADAKATASTPSSKETTE